MRRTIFALAAAIVATGAIGTPAVADGKPVTPSAQPAEAVPGGFSSWRELFSVQERLNSAADEIMAARGDGFAGVVAAPEDRKLTVYWKGQVPGSVRDLAKRLAVPVRFKPARFHQREMVAEAQRLAADPRAVSVSAKVDGSGLAVTVTGRAPAAGKQDVLRTARLPLSLSTASRPTLLNRQNDFAPYWGGARYYAAGGCSTGFGVYWNDARQILSAGHCGSNGQVAYDGGGPTNTMGSIINDNNPRDTLMIRVAAGGRIYTGPYNAATSIGVGGAVSDYVGNYVCTGGASSGEHCSIRVSVVNQFINVGYVIGPVTQANHVTAGACAAAPGDSGGPVYSYRSDGRVDARGTISAGVTGTAVCPGVVANGSSTVWYAPLLRPVGDAQIGSLTYHGASLIQG
ncbi:S1 family peptidase [Micromonospora purpureochromogenes]|uniref:S1 family peptidase n=1 Tax=Micromonospora purpureochromogenes TaxID=47872 RepID=UPI0033CBCA14